MNHLKSIIYDKQNQSKIILLLAVILRLAFGFINDDANDNHWEFAYLINRTPQFPVFNFCHECFQPPVFYWIIAKTGKMLHFDSLNELRILMQGFSMAAGVVLCFIIYKWHNVSDINPKFKNASLMFWLFNTTLLGLNCMATNDTILIALVSGSVMFFYCYIKNGKLLHLVLSVLLAVLAPVIKGSGLAIIPMFVWIVLIFNYRSNFDLKRVFLSLIFLAAAGLFIDWAGGYARKRHAFGNSLLINCEKPIKAGWDSEQGDIKIRYGIKNIKSGYFNFPFLSIIKTPFINDAAQYPVSRTNFWIQLYGQFYSVQFISHPYSWNHHHPDYYNITRVVYIIGLVLLLVFIIGIIFTLFQILLHFKKSLFNPDLHVLSFALFILFLILNIAYSYQYRDFGFIKMAYLFPSVLGCMGLFNKGLQVIFKIRFLKTAVFYIMCVVILYFVFDYLLLFKKCLE